MALPVIVALGILAAPLARAPVRGEVRLGPSASSTLAVELTRLMFPYLGSDLARGARPGCAQRLRPVPAARRDADRPQPLHRGRDRHRRWWCSAGGPSGWRSACSPAVSLSSGCSGRVRARRPVDRARTGGVLTPRRATGAGQMAPTVTTLGIYPLTLMLSNRFAASVGQRRGDLRLQRLARQRAGVRGGDRAAHDRRAPDAGGGAQPSELAARDTLAFALRLLSSVAIPSTVFSAVLATPMIGALFGGGKYTLDGREDGRRRRCSSTPWGCRSSA